MHCRNCLRKSNYFSVCMHPYCEKCYKTQKFCNLCNCGKSGKSESVILNFLRYLNLY